MRSAEEFDSYLAGELEGPEKETFERRLEADPAFASAFRAHKALIKTMRAQAERDRLRAKIRSAHERNFGPGSGQPIFAGGRFARTHGRTIAIAASTAFIAVLATVAALSTGGYLLKKQNNEIVDLNRLVRELKASNDAIVEGITKGARRPVYAPATLEGSAFAISAKGYLVTSLHMVKEADSVFIQNKFTDRTVATVVYRDPKLDLAVLHVDIEGDKKQWNLPYSLKDRPTDIGERVFTLGYPRREMVYGEGALSASSGYDNDTTMYQISIPVNPGNSGGPLLDEAGNVIGLIRSKASGSEATGFATKASAILESLKLADDSLRLAISESVAKRSLKGAKRSDQVKKLHPFVFNVLVYN